MHFVKNKTFHNIKICKKAQIAPNFLSWASSPSDFNWGGGSPWASGSRQKNGWKTRRGEQLCKWQLLPCPYKGVGSFQLWGSPGTGAGGCKNRLQWDTGGNGGSLQEQPRTLVGHCGLTKSRSISLVSITVTRALGCRETCMQSVSSVLAIWKQ